MLVLKVGGEGGRCKADALAALMRGLLKGCEDVRVSCPENIADL